MPLDHAVTGIYPIAPTPFHEDGRIDFESIGGLTAFYRKVGVATGSTVLGVLGEASKLDDKEALEVTSRFIRCADGLPVIVGVLRAGVCGDACAGSRRDGRWRRRCDDRPAEHAAHG